MAIIRNLKQKSAHISSSYAIGFLSILLAAVLWGTAGIVSSLSIELSPLVLTAVSICFGGTLHTLLSLKQILANLEQLRTQKLKVCLGAIAGICCPLFFYSSISLAGVSIGTVLSIGCAPLFSVVLESIFEKKKLSFNWAISFVFGIGGILLLSYSPELKASFGNPHAERNLGMLLGLLSSLSYAIYAFTIRHFISIGIASRAAMGSVFGICAILMLPILLMQGQNIFKYSENIWVAIYIPLVPMFLGYFLFSFGLKRIPTSQAMTLALMEIPVASALAILFLNERLSFLNYSGFIFLLFCVLILLKS